MDDTEVRMTNLFRQLGLDSSEAAIAEFIKTHQLPADMDIADATYWSAAQRQFLTEELKGDAAWAIVVDQLSESLREDALKGKT